MARPGLEPEALAPQAKSLTTSPSLLPLIKLERGWACDGAGGGRVNEGMSRSRGWGRGSTSVTR